jgi:hypothetical protein
MDKQQAIQRIVDICTDDDGFLMRLHAYQSFHQDKYYDLIDALAAYRRLIGKEEDINRRVVGCLFDLVQILEQSLHYHARHPHPVGAELEKLEQAHIEMWNIIHEMFSLPSAQA